jgi:hypothetical protein
LGKSNGTNCDAILENILDANSLGAFCSWSPHCMSKIFVPNFVSSPFLVKAFTRAWVLFVIHIDEINWFHCIPKHKFFKVFLSATGHFD